MSNNDDLKMESTPFLSFNEKFMLNDDGFFTFTSIEQKRVEDQISQEAELLAPSKSRQTWLHPVLHRRKHLTYIINSLRQLGKGYVGLDASRTWLCYWGVHSLNLLGYEIPDELADSIIQFLATCQDNTGGYGGGPGQMPHLAPTYAAVLTLISLKKDKALKSINRSTLRTFLLGMKQQNGSYTMHRGGEADMRGVYCALAVAVAAQIIDDDMREGVGEWIVSCQTYEGGFGGEPGTEAHGGYTFCAAAALTLLERTRLADNRALLKWLANRQMQYEGGFQGRVNKLVDGCYSFWQAAVFELTVAALEREGHEGAKSAGRTAFNPRMLEEYVLVACQDPNGGLRDKPEKGRDLYHTCYVLSGLAVAQGHVDGELLGGELAQLEPTHPVLNITLDSEEFARDYFFSNPVPAT